MKRRRCCACEGHTLDRLLQPTVLGLLARGPRHGYVLVEQLSQSSMLHGVTPDDTGVYRLLKALEAQGLVSHTKEVSERGPAKGVFRLTKSGRRCLAKWTTTLDGYQRAVAKLVRMLQKASGAAAAGGSRTS